MPSAREPEPWKDAVRIVHEPNGRWHIEVDREKVRLLDEHLLAPPSPRDGTVVRRAHRPRALRSR